MRVRAMSWVSLTFMWCTLLQLAFSTFRWEEILDQIINRTYTEVPAGFNLPLNFRFELFSSMPNDSFIWDSFRPYNSLRRAAKYTPTSERIGAESHVQLLIYQQLTQLFRIPRDRAIAILSSSPSPSCQIKPVSCDTSSPYRTIDGTCNNLQHVKWGASFRAFERLLPAHYHDGLGEPRRAISNSTLPNPRNISTTIHYDVINPDLRITNLVPQIGQFLDHDLSLAPEADRRCSTSEPRARDCLPIQIPQDDPFYSNLRQPQTCMDFTRSTPFCFPGESETREQFNIITSYVDASQVYGSEIERAKQLRAGSGGRLAQTVNSNMLPTVAQIQDTDNTKIAFMGKYLAGDERVNEMPGLTTMHTHTGVELVLVREHNRIAAEIERIRPTWTEERIYQESRRILIAEWQNVVYGEYLPVILGPAAMTKYGLELGNDYSSYHDSMNPTIFQAFATAAYRFGHTLINGIIQLYRGLKNVGSYQLKDNFFESEQLDNNSGDGYNLILGGLLIQNAQEYDPHVTTALTQFLLKSRNDTFGTDLIARNIQRGRDHGVRSYSHYRKFCNLSALTTWEERPAEVPTNVWSLMKDVYQSPQDIDLFTGGISEMPLTDAYSGATFNCLKGMQFRQLQSGDRFFFTHANQTGSFTRDQLRNLRARRLRDIICENSNLQNTTVNVFRTQHNTSNPLVDCNDSSRNHLDFELLLPKS